MADGTRRFSLRIHDKLLTRVRISSKVNRRSTNEEILALIERGLEAQKKPRRARPRPADDGPQPGITPEGMPSPW